MEAEKGTFDGFEPSPTTHHSGTTHDSRFIQHCQEMELEERRTWSGEDANRERCRQHANGSSRNVHSWIVRLRSHAFPSAKRAMPAQLVDFTQALLIRTLPRMQRMGSALLCSLSGDRILLKPLRTARRSLRFPFKLHPQVLAVRDFPQRRPPWLLGLFPDGAKGGDLSEKTTGCLLSDIKGNVFLFSMAPDS